MWGSSKRSPKSLGDDEFEKEARGYIESTDSRHFSVRNYGAALGERLEKRLSTPRGQALKELAEWEWRLAAVFDAADDVPLDVQELARWLQGSGPRCLFPYVRAFGASILEPTTSNGGAS
jgi:hypothetical protein